MGNGKNPFFVFVYDRIEVGVVCFYVQKMGGKKYVAKTMWARRGRWASI